MHQEKTQCTTSTNRNIASVHSLCLLQKESPQNVRQQQMLNFVNLPVLKFISFQSYIQSSEFWLKMLFKWQLLIPIILLSFICTSLSSSHSKAADKAVQQLYFLVRILNKGPFPSHTEVCFSPVSCMKLASSILFHLISALEGSSLEFGELNA